MRSLATAEPVDANTLFGITPTTKAFAAAALSLLALDAQGRATGFKMRATSPTTDFSYAFQDPDLQRMAEYYAGLPQ